MSHEDEQHSLSRLETLRGMRRWNLRGALMAVHSSITTGAYTTGYALHLGASNALIGVLTSAPSWGSLLQTLSPLFTERLARRKLLCVTAFAVSYAMWLPVALIPFFFMGEFRPWAMVAFVAISGVALALASPAATSWLTDLVPHEVRGRFVGRQQSIIAGVGLVVSLGAGAYLDLFPGDHQETGFVSLFIIAVVFAMASIAIWTRIPEPPKLKVAQESPLHLLSLPFRHKDFRTMTILISIRTLASMTAGPFFAVYMLQTLKISYASIALFVSINTLATIGMRPLWGYLADKFGYRPILLICGAGIAFFPLPWVFTTVENYWIVIPAAQVWGGIMAAGIPLAQFNLMVNTAPEENRSVYLGCHRAMVNAASALGALLGGAAAALCADLGTLNLFGHPIANLQYLFLGSVVLRLTSVALLRRVNEATSTSARVVIEQVSRGRPWTAIWNLIRMTRSSDPVIKARAARELGESRSPLAIDELVLLLDDSDLEVRREVVRALGAIGDESAVTPLMEKVSGSYTDVAEEAVEALGEIRTPLSLTFLVTLLNDARAPIRKRAVLALGNLGDSRAEQALEHLLEHERDDLILLEIAQALGKIGNERVLGRLERLLRDSRPGFERKELAQSICRLLGTSEALYRLFQEDAMHQDAMVARVCTTSRRHLVHRRFDGEFDRTLVETQIEQGLRYFERQQYTEAIACLHRVASHTLQSLATSTRGGVLIAEYIVAHPPDNQGGDHISLLLENNRDLRLNMNFLDDMYGESHHRQLHLEEFLIGVLAFQQVANELIRLAHA